MALRVFLGAFGQPGHAFPMIALGARLSERGHSVALETWSRWREHAVGHEIEFIAAPEYPVFPTKERPLQPYEAVVRAAAVTREAIRAFQPDVVVHDILTLAPALAAELQGVPHATLIPHVYPVMERGFPPYALGARLPRTELGRRLWGLTQHPVEAGLRQGRRELNDTRRQLGLPPTERLHGGLSERLVIVGTFPQLEYPRSWPRHVHVVGPLMWEPPYGVVAPPPGEEPLVVVAPSTAQDQRQELLRATLAGLACTDVRVLATTNLRALPAPTRMGRRARLVNWLSYSRSFPRAALVVCHAGHGTLVRALACGAPVLAVPHSGDMGENAARLEWSGAGMRLPWRALSPRAVNAAVQRALDPSAQLAARAEALRSWIAAHDPPTRACELIEQLAVA